MRKICIYLSGPITGVENYRAIFAKATKKLQKDGYEVLNPATLPAGKSNAQYMRINFAQIELSDCVVLLPGWKKSKGAQLEKAFAEYIGKPVMSYGEEGEE